ncbi:MAG: hypothetical protein ABIP12_05865 [Terriglobales bacterium]
MKRLSLIVAILFVFVASAGACEKPQAAEHQAHMKVILDKVNGTWEQAQSAATPAARELALRSHGEALAELKAMHQKHLAAMSSEKKMDCKEMMAKKKAAGEECKMECCKAHKADATAEHKGH